MFSAFCARCLTAIEKSPPRLHCHSWAFTAFHVVVDPYTVNVSCIVSTEFSEYHKGYDERVGYPRVIFRPSCLRVYVDGRHVVKLVLSTDLKETGTQTRRNIRKTKYLYVCFTRPVRLGNPPFTKNGLFPFWGSRDEFYSSTGKKRP